MVDFKTTLGLIFFLQNQHISQSTSVPSYVVKASKPFPSNKVIGAHYSAIKLNIIPTYVLCIKKFKELIKTHDLYFLGKKLNAPNEILVICDNLNSFYVESRYPDVFVEFEKETVIAGVNDTMEVIKWVKNQL